MQVGENSTMILFNADQNNLCDIDLIPVVHKQGGKTMFNSDSSEADIQEVSFEYLVVL